MNISFYAHKHIKLPFEYQTFGKEKQRHIGEPMCKGLMCLCHLVSIHTYIYMKKKTIQKLRKSKKVKVTEWWASELPCMAAWIINCIILGIAVTLTTRWMAPPRVVQYGSLGGLPFLWDLNILFYKKN